MSDGIGDRYHKETRYDRERMPFRVLDWASKPPVYKEYLEVRAIELPAPGRPDGFGLHEAISSRRSVRDFSDEPIDMQQLSYLLWASTGIQRVEQGYEFRTAPSAGALYPIETYVAANRVTGVSRGLYHHSIRRHALEELKAGDFGTELARAALDQALCIEAAAVFIWTAVFERSKWKYEQRGYRYVYMDAGHICENLYLAATGLGLGACAIGALFDDELNSLLGVDGVDESAIYMCATGKPLRA